MESYQSYNSQIRLSYATVTNYLQILMAYKKVY